MNGSQRSADDDMNKENGWNELLDKDKKTIRGRPIEYFLNLPGGMFRLGYIENYV